MKIYSTTKVLKLAWSVGRGVRQTQGGLSAVRCTLSPLRYPPYAIRSLVKNVEAEPGRRGFTIAELLLVVVIIALVGGAGGGLYVGTYKRLMVEKAARDLLLTAKYARIAAVERLRPYEIQLDVQNNRFLLATSLLNEETGQTELSIVKNYYCKPVEFPGDVKFEDVQIVPAGTETTTDAEDKQKIVFSPNGNAQSAVIQIGDGKTHFTVSVSAATGKAAMYFGKAENVKTKTIDLDAE